MVKVVSPEMYEEIAELIKEMSSDFDIMLEALQGLEDLEPDNEELVLSLDVNCGEIQCGCGEVRAKCNQILKLISNA